MSTIEEEDINILSIQGLRRVYYDELYHDNDALFSTWKVKKIQIYTLEKSSYGCMISSLEERILWFEHKPHGACISPCRTLSFEDLLLECDPSDSNILLFNLDIFVPGDSK